MPQDFSPGAAGKSSCASREVEQQVAATETEPDTIDLLEGPMSCSLVIRPGGYHIKVARGQVLSGVHILHTVLIRTGYAVVTVDMVHSNATDHVLEVSPMRKS